MSDRRAELRRQWRADCKKLHRHVLFAEWLRVFDSVKAATLKKETDV